MAAALRQQQPLISDELIRPKSEHRYRYRMVTLSVKTKTKVSSYLSWVPLVPCKSSESLFQPFGLWG